MSKFDWKALVSGIAPTLATAFGGPLAGAAVSAVAKAVLGKDDATEAELGKALQSASPEALAAIRKADQDFAAKMQELDIDLERVAAGDRDSARRREVDAHDSLTPRLLSAVVVFGFFGCVGYVLAGRVEISGEAGVLIGTLIGYVSAKADQVCSYYFGSSSSSKAKDQMLYKSTPAK